MSHIYNIAGKNFSFDAMWPLQLADDGGRFGGFAAPYAAKPDYNVVIRSALSVVPPTFEPGTSFEGNNSEVADYAWVISVDADGTERIVVNYGRHPIYLWAMATISGNEIVVDVCRHRTEQIVIEPYIHPLFNIILARLSHRHRSFLVHSSVVADGGRGYLFTAVSGTGKSTMARLWQEAGATIINDDMHYITIGDNSLTVRNIPMPNYNQPAASATLNAIFLISQSQTNFIRKISGVQAVTRLMVNTVYFPLNKQTIATHLANISQASQMLPIFELGFKPDADIVQLVRDLNL